PSRARTSSFTSRQQATRQGASGVGGGRWGDPRARRAARGLALGCPAAVTAALVGAPWRVACCRPWRPVLALAGQHLLLYLPAAGHTPGRFGRGGRRAVCVWREAGTR